MNKKLYSLILAVLTLTGFMSSCSSKEDIVFDHERQQFETRADRILLSTSLHSVRQPATRSISQVPSTTGTPRVIHSGC